MKKLLSIGALLSVVSFCCVSCESEEIQEPVGQVDKVKLNDLGIKTLSTLVSEGRNVSVSPVSIVGAFSLIQKGAAGETAKELSDVLGDAPAFSRYYKEYVTGKDSLAYANMLAIDKTLKVQSSFLKGVAGEELRMADFKTDPDKERNQINDWVKAKTKDRIEELMPANSLTKMTEMVAVNALTFDGSWSTPFDEKLTKDRPFQIPGVGETNVPMMLRSGEFIFSMDKGDCTMVSLPYDEKTASGKAVFVILMPKEGTVLKDFVASLDWSKVSTLLPQADAKPRNIQLLMPKFEVKGDTMRLSDSLKAVGIRAIFDQNQADLSAITGNKELYLNEAYHQCYVKVNEKGTQAAAATGLGIMRMSLPMTVNINRPFFWMIYDQQEEMILFCGTMENPAASTEGK